MQAEALVEQWTIAVPVKECCQAWCTASLLESVLLEFQSVCVGGSGLVDVTSSRTELLLGDLLFPKTLKKSSPGVFDT